ncbi:helix-turn-helix domain-containing protein, partial [Streptococcus pyogenes]
MEKNNLQSFIAKRIRKIRLQRGMTQEQLEEKADLGVNYAYKLENLATNIKINTLEKVLNALDITITDFF